MSLEVIWQAVARQAGLVTGIKAAYGNAAGTGVQAATEDVLDGPVAIVDYSGSEIRHGSFEVLTHDFAIVIWLPMGNGTRDAAVKTLAPMFERFHLAFDQNVGLFGTATQAIVTGSSGFEDDDIDGKPYLTQVILIQATEAVSLTHTIGPSS